MTSRDPRRELVQGRLSALTSDFGRYVDAYDERVSFTTRQLRLHHQTIALRRQAKGAEEAIDSADFLLSLRSTLQAWGLGLRRSRLAPGPESEEAIRSARAQIEALDGLLIEDPALPVEVGERVWRAIESIGVVDNRAKLVAGTKTLHHLLPDLVVPMDRRWTGMFFQLHPHEWQDPPNQRRTFLRTYQDFCDIARTARPQQYVDGHHWRTSRTKIVDNALIGFCKVELSNAPGEQTTPIGQALSFRVPGLPPAKNEALSMLGAGHSHAPRVLELLRAAKDALERSSFATVDDDPVALEVVVHARPGQDPRMPRITWAASPTFWRRSLGEERSIISVSCVRSGCIGTIARSRRSRTDNSKRPTPTTPSGSASSPTQRGCDAQPRDRSGR
jgi:hypothetical protein